MKFLFLALMTTGCLTSAHLMQRHFELAGTGSVEVDRCRVWLGASCTDALESGWAVQLGVPLAGWGLVYYGTLAALLLLGWSVGDAFRREAALGALLLGVIGAAISLFLLGSMGAGAAPWCPLCAIVHVANLILVIPLKQMTGRRAGELMAAIVAAARYAAGSDVDDAQQARWKGVGFLAAVLVGVAIYQWVYVQHTVRAASSDASWDPEETLVLFEKLSPQEIPIDDDDAQSENRDAPVRLVVFSDFQCPGCTKFAGTLAAIEQRFSERVHVVFKHFPLSSQCNPLLGNDLHPRACEAAAAGEAARRQGKFWAFHDALFAANLFQNQDLTLAEVAEQAGLDLEQFREDRRCASVAEKVQDNVDQGVSLGLDGTPAVFLNGRRVYDIRLQTLEFLIGHELEHHSHTRMHAHERADETSVNERDS